MKVNELSKLTGVNIETIRSYREKGLLHPEKLKNGYYDYGLGDYISLIYIRKYRGYSIGLNDISSFYSAKSNEEIHAVIDKEQQILSERIARLEEEKRYLELERIHLSESSHKISSAAKSLPQPAASALSAPPSKSALPAEPLRYIAAQVSSVS